MYSDSITNAVADLLREFERKEKNYIRKIKRYRAYFSLDVGDKIESEILFADNSKAIIGGDCGIIVYSFEKNQITLYASYDYLRDLGLSIPFGNASSDGRIVYINDGAQSFAGVEQANDNYLHLVLDTQEKTIMENSGYYSSDTVERYSVYDLDDDTKEEYGMNEYSNGSYVVNNDTIVYAQLKPNWEPENLSIVRYDKSDHKMDEFKLFS